MEWFQNMYSERGEGKNPSSGMNSVLLAISFCYISRLGQRKERRLFESKLLNKMKNHNIHLDIHSVIDKEQRRILKCMDLPQGIAKNEALRENVFVMFVCIMAKLPLFVVGKPGSSKSLSMQILRNSLRGSHSADDYLKKLPSLYVASCQGSENLVSTDVIKVFDKAKEYNKQNAKAGEEDTLLPLVLLDEVGLAECSPHNPLKVLHALLEPGKSEFPEVAVVGISNWALDASKMNRAIHLSRPDLDEDGLYETGITIADDFLRKGHHLPNNFRNVIKSVACAYFEYTSKQKDKGQIKRHFHGLRDFYSLVKYLCRPLGEGQDQSKLMDHERIVKGILRNFGGFTYPSERTEMLKHFVKRLKEHLPGIEGHSAQSLQLIGENLSDHDSRHMLLLSSGDSALSVIQDQLTQLKRNYKVVFGSKFKDDQNSEDYHCRKLSDIILCMEQGSVLVLKDLDGVYGSLYDMLNQNYSTIGEKQICRVARGAFSNPMCEVHKDFKCIVLIDVEKIDYTDPPFLNRFEKQVLNIMDLLNEKEGNLKERLDQWISNHACVDGFGDNVNSFIMNHHKELISSLVLRDRRKDANLLNTDESEQEKRKELLHLALPDAVMRFSRCREADNFEDTQKTYFSLPTHLGLKTLIDAGEVTRVPSGRDAAVRRVPPAVDAALDSHLQNAEGGFRKVLFTHSNIYTDIGECLDATSTFQVEKLGAIKAEKQLDGIIRNFLADETKTIFFLQCKLNTDASHLILARSLIENLSRERKKTKSEKNFCIIVHVDRNEIGNGSLSHYSLFNYLSGWQLLTIDSLEKQEYSLQEISKMSVAEVIKTRSSFYKFSSIIKDQLLRAFLNVRFTGTSRPPQELNDLIQKISKSEELMGLLTKEISKCLEQRDENVWKTSMIDPSNWVVEIACDNVLIAESHTLLEALKEFITNKIKRVLNAIIFNAEKLHAWPCILQGDNTLLRGWGHLFLEKSIFKIPEDLVNHPQADSFTVNGRPLDLHFPFSHVFVSYLEEGLHDLVTSDLKELENEDENLDDDNRFIDEIWRKLTEKHIATFEGCVASLRHKEIFERYLDDFMDDVCVIYTGMLPINIPKDCRLKIIKQLIQVEKITNFHAGDRSWDECASVCLEFLLRLWHNSTLVFDILHMLDACYIVGQKDVVEKFLNELNHLTGTEDPGTACDRPSLSFDSDRFADKLVNTLCLNLMPTAKVLDKCEDIHSWQNQAGKLLSVASRVGWSVPALHMLRVCNDFASVIIEGSSKENLVRLAEKAKVDKEIGLESLEFVNLLKELLQKPETPANSESIHRFMCLYFGRCLDADGETKMLDTILDYTLPKNFQVRYFGPVLYRCIKPYDTVLCNVNAMIEDSEFLRDYPVLKAIDRHLGEVDLDGIAPPGLKFAVLCCDFMEYAVMQSDRMKLNPEDLMCISSQDETLNILLPKIAEVIHSAKECSLKFICCVAFARAFLRAVAEMLAGDPTETAHEGAKKLVQCASKLFDAEEECVKTRCHYTMGYNLRALYDLSSYDHLQQVCSQNLKSQVAGIEAIEWPRDPSWNIIGFNPFRDLDNDEESHSALDALMSHNHSSDLMKDYLSKINSDRKESLLSALMVTAYLKRVRNPPTDDEKEGARLLGELLHSNGLPVEYCQVANCLSGYESYKQLESATSTPELRIKELVGSTTIHELRIKVLILHILSVAVSHDGFLGSLTRSPSEGDACFQRMFCRSAGESDQSGAMSCAECKKCGCFTVSSQKSETCIRCHSKDDIKIVTPPDQLSNNTMESEVFTGYLSPKAYRASSIAIRGCVLGSLLTEISKMDQVPSSVGSDIETLIYSFQNDILILKNILDTGERTVFSFLHKVVSLFKKVGCEILRTKEAVGQFEKEVTSIVENWHPKEMELYTRSEGVLDLIMEVERPVDSFHHFFRITPDRKFSGVLAGLSRQTKSSEHMVLRLITQNRSQLELLEFLHPLVNWTMKIKKVMGHRINRAEAAKKSVDEVIEKETGHQSHQAGVANKCSGELKDSLTKFRVAWQQLVERKPIISAMQPLLARNMDKVDLTQRFDQFVMDNEESALYLMIQFLVKLQNEFLNRVMKMVLSSSGASTNVPFMYHSFGKAIVPLIPIEDISEKDIIGAGEYAFDKVLFLIESDPWYGHGMGCSYDFDKVEYTLARDLLFGKCYIQTQGHLPLFLYEEELFFSCETLLFDIHGIIQQSPIGETIQHGLDSDLDKCPYRVRDMLMNLEVVLTLLKKTGGNPKQLLEGYVASWMKSAIDTFPFKLLAQTRQSISLCHVSELYEYYELKYASTTIGNLPGDKFYVSPTEEVKRLVRDCFPKLQDKGINQEDLVDAMKRYVVRYLRGRISTLTSAQLEMSLQDVLLTKRTLWPRDPFHEERFDWDELRKIIPRPLLVRQIGEIVKECNKFLKDSFEKAKLVADWMPHARPASGGRRRKTTTVDM